MNRYICIHAHFYQPPRENPWLESVEAQPSAYPYHDWNERITAECYAPNSASRIVDERGRITEIVNNYSRISFNFGPTLLAWMEANSPELYRSILEADRLSQERFSGHGSAIAQVYNHIIMPLANRRDKETQILWGIRDFESRFHRAPQGMWLAETAVDLESLDIMAAAGIRFTILAPSQAASMRKIGTRAFRDVSGARIDPSRAYSIKLPSGRSMTLFFYDGPISRAVAFEKLLNSGEQFAQRLMTGFSDQRDWPQLMHIATDGESYGHHHAHGDMALAYALKHIEDNQLARLTNYGEFLQNHPPEHEVRIFERTAWSCSHGVERWNSNCGCNSGTSWEQHWRRPLRVALDWLRDAVAPIVEEQSQDLLPDPRAARNDYIEVVLDRSPRTIEAFLLRNAVGEHFPHELSADENTSVVRSSEVRTEDHVCILKLMEIERHAMLMYTSCGWFFDEVSGIETVQILEYAGRVVQLAQAVIGNADAAKRLESEFVALLAQVKSNLPEQRDAAHIYQRWIKPAKISLTEVGAHYAISSLFERSEDKVPTFCYTVRREDFHSLEAGHVRMAVGRAEVTSKITLESEDLVFAALHFGDHNVTAGVRRFDDSGHYKSLVRDVSSPFSRGDVPATLRALDQQFGAPSHTLSSLLGDERNNILEMLLTSTLREAEAAYRHIYNRHAPLLRFLGTFGMQKPRILNTTAEFVLNASLQRELGRHPLDPQRLKSLLEQATVEEVALDKPGLGYRLEQSLNAMVERLTREPQNLELLQQVSAAAQLASSLDLPVKFWRIQNLYWDMARTYLPQARQFPPQWVVSFLTLAERLGVTVTQFQAEPQSQEQLQLAS